MTESERPREPHGIDERYQQLVELAPDAILIHDGERIVLANAAAVRLAGASRRDEVVGQPIDAFLDPPHLKSVEAELVSSVHPTDAAPPVADRFRRLDGTEIDVAVRSVAYIEDGRPSAHLVIRDMTERLAAERAARQLEERLARAQKLESVGELAGGVAHEVNNMMAVVLGLCEFLLEDRASPAERLADTQQIMKAAERAAAITHQLLTFSRRAIHQPEVVELGAAVRGAESMVQRLLGPQRRLVVVEEAASRVWADPGQLERILVDLAMNARDAMPDGGTLTITTAEVDLPSEIVAVDGAAIPAGRYATLVVEDTGVGIDPSTKARIFEPFFTTKPFGEGSGLGLPAVHGAITQNAGFITLESAEGDGAAFTLYLPVVPADEAVVPSGGPKPADVDAAPAVTTVLVVDDEPGVRSVITRILEHAGFRVLAAVDGTDALSIVDREGLPDLVLTDIVMPNIGGAELARQLRRRFPAIPILFMSGYSTDELHRQGLTGPGETVLLKPFRAAGLLGSVNATLSRRSGARAGGGEARRA